jgi:hypothetical protein
LPATAQLSANPETPHFLADLPLLDCDGTPCVEVKIGDGKPIRLLIDSGDVDSVLDAKAATGAKLPLEPDPRAPGMGKTTVAELHLGSLALANLPFATMDVEKLTTANQLPHSAGTLAYSVFKDRILQLDFRAHRVRISDKITAGSQCTADCARFSLITIGKQGPAIVVAEGFEVNGHKITAQVDTLYTGSLLIYNDAIRGLGLEAASSRSSEIRDFPYTDGGVNMKEAYAQKEKFAGTELGGIPPTVYFPTPGVHEPDGLFDATIGLELMRDSVVSLDFHNQTISIRR